MFYSGEYIRFEGEDSLAVFCTFKRLNFLTKLYLLMLAKFASWDRHKNHQGSFTSVCT